MEKIPPHIEKSLEKYLDNTLSRDERTRFLDSLKDAPESVRKAVASVMATDVLLREMELMAPSKNFTQNVMRNLQEGAVTAQVSIKNGLFLLSGVVIILIVTALSLSSGVFDNQTVTFGQLTLAERYLRMDLPTLALDASMLVNLILLLNLAVGFLVLDRAVLKPYFQRRMQAGQ